MKSCKNKKVASILSLCLLALPLINAISVDMEEILKITFQYSDGDVSIKSVQQDFGYYPSRIVQPEYGYEFIFYDEAGNPVYSFKKNIKPFVVFENFEEHTARVVETKKFEFIEKIPWIENISSMKIKDRQGRIIYNSPVNAGLSAESIDEIMIRKKNEKTIKADAGFKKTASSHETKVPENMAFEKKQLKGQAAADKKKQAGYLALMVASLLLLIVNILSIIKRKKAMNKKSIISFEVMIKVFFHFIFMVFIIITFFTLIRMYYLTQISITGTEALIFSERLVYDPNILAYRDKITGRAYPGIIDMENFDEKRIEKSLVLKNNDHIAAKLTLRFLDDDRKEEAFYNKNWYEIWSQLLYMRGSAPKQIFEERYVLVRDVPDLKICDNEKKYPDMPKLCMTPGNAGSLHSLASGMPHYDISFEQLAAKKEDSRINECCTALIISSDPEFEGIDPNDAVGAIKRGGHGSISRHYDSLNDYQKKMLFEDKAGSLFLRLVRVRKGSGVKKLVSRQDGARKVVIKSPLKEGIERLPEYKNKPFDLDDYEVLLHKSWMKMYYGKALAEGFVTDYKTGKKQAFPIMVKYENLYFTAIKDISSRNRILLNSFIRTSLGLRDIPDPDPYHQEEKRLKPAILTIEVLMGE